MKYFSTSSSSGSPSSDINPPPLGGPPSGKVGPSLGKEERLRLRQQLAAKTLESLNLALAFAWHKRKALLQGGFLAGLLEIFLTYIQYNVRMTPQQVFLVVMVGLACTAWLMTFAGMYCVNYFRGQELSSLKLALKAVQHLPKVLLSYVILVAVALALFPYPPLLLFAIFGIWAPAYCVAEIFALPLKEKEVEEEPDDAFSDEVVYKKVIHFRFFQARPLWDLGFARSIAFVGQYFFISLQFAVFAWIAAVVPAGVMLLLVGYYPSFSSVMLEILVANFFQVLLLGVGMVTFLLLLPPEALAEIGLPPREELLKQIPSADNVPGLLHPNKRKYAVLLLALLGVLSTQRTWKWIERQHMMPESVKVSLERTEIIKDRLIVSLHLIDDQQLFRWLNTGNLRMKLTLPGEAQVGDSSKEVVLTPERVMPFGVDGTPLEEGNFTPYSRPLRLVLYFARPPLDEISKNEVKFIIVHNSLLGEGGAIASGVLSAEKEATGDVSQSGVGSAEVKNGKPT